MNVTENYPRSKFFWYVDLLSLETRAKYIKWIPHGRRNVQITKMILLLLEGLGEGNTIWDMTWLTTFGWAKSLSHAMLCRVGIRQVNRALCWAGPCCVFSTNSYDMNNVCAQTNGWQIVNTFRKLWNEAWISFFLRPPPPACLAFTCAASARNTTHNGKM